MARIKKFKVVESSNLEQIYYDRKGRILFVEFKNGVTYRYNDVTYYRYRMLVNSYSKGGYFNQFIKGKFNYERIE